MPYNLEDLIQTIIDNEIKKLYLIQFNLFFNLIYKIIEHFN